MKPQAGALGIAVTLAFALVAPAAAANLKVAGDVALASSISYDETTGEGHAVMVQVLAAAGQTAEIGYSSDDEVPITCPGGWDGLAITIAHGQGEGSLQASRDLRSASLSGVVDIESITMNLCGDEDPIAASTDNVAIVGTLVGAGPRLMATQALAMRELPGANLRLSEAIAAREATGTFAIGTSAFRVDDGLIGRVTDRAHASLRPAAMARLAMAALTARSVGSSAAHGSAVFAQASWERANETTYEGLLVAAARLGGGETIVEVHGFSERAVVCEDGWIGYDDVIRDGYAPGTATIPSRYLSASFSANVDITTVRLDGCTGEETTTVESDVAVRGRLTGVGRILQDSIRLMVRSGPHLVTHQRVWETVRLAEGRMTIGPLTYGATAAAIGIQRWTGR